MKRKLNVRLLVRVVGTGFLIMLLLHIVHGFQISSQASTLFEQGMEAKAKKNYRRASLYLNHYLQRKPEDRNARVEQALILALSAQSPPQQWRAIAVLHRLLKDDPENKKARHHLARIAVKLKKYDQAITALKPLRKQTKEKERGELEHTLGWCYLGADEVQESLRCFRAAIDHAPGFLPGYVDLARLLRREKQTKKAELTINSMIKVNSKNAQAFVERGRYLRKSKRWAEAAADYEEARRLAPDNIDIYIESAELARARGFLDQARLLLQQGLKAREDHAHLYFVLGYVERDLGQFEKAIHYLETGLKKVPDSPSLLMLNAEMLLSRGQIQKVKELQSRLLKLKGSETEGDYLQALLEIREKKWVTAARRLERLQSAFFDRALPAHNLELALARCYEGCDDLARAVKSCERALRRDGMSQRALIARNRALFKQGRFYDALLGWQRLTQRKIKLPGGIWIEKAKAGIRVNQLVEKKRRNWRPVLDDLQQARKSGANAIDLVTTTAEYHLVEGNVGEAESILTTALTEHSEELRLWIALAEAHAFQRNWRRAGLLLRQAQQKLGDKPELRINLLRLVLRRGSLTRQTAQQLLGWAKGIEKFDPREQGEILQILATIHARSGNFSEAMHLCLDWCEAQPASLAARIALFDLAYYRWSERLLDIAIEDMKKIEGQRSVNWHCSATRRWIKKLERTGDVKAIKKAEEHLRLAANLEPRSTRVLLLHARLSELKGKREDAIQDYITAFERGMRDPQTVEHLITLLIEKKQYLKAEKHYLTYTKNARAHPSLARQGTRIALKNGDGALAAKRARIAVPPTSGDYRDFLWLAEVHQQLDRFIEAREILEEAARRFPQVVGVWVGLVRHFALTREHDQAGPVMERMAKEIRASDLALARALCYQELGDPQQAEKAYLLAFQQKSSDPLVAYRVSRFYLRFEMNEKAQEFLRRLIQNRLQAPTQHVVWARRQLAILVSRFDQIKSGDKATALQARRVREALEILKANHRDNQSTLSDRRFTLLVQATLPAERSRALGDLEDTLKSGKLSDEERFLLARLYKVIGERARADNHLRILLRTNPRNGLYVAAYLRLLIEEKSWVEAKPWLFKLQTLEPKSKRARDLEMQIKKG